MTFLLGDISHVYNHIPHIDHSVSKHHVYTDKDNIYLLANRSDTILDSLYNSYDDILDESQISKLKPSVNSIIDKYTITDVFSTGPEYGLNCICLDSCAGESIFRSKQLFTHITYAEYPLIVRGVSSDSSPMTVTQEGNTIFGTIYYSSKCVANVLSLGSTIDNSYKVRYLDKRDQFLVQVTEGGNTYIFNRSVSTNTYVCDLDTDIADSRYILARDRVILVSTVAENKKKYSHREIKAAAVARTYQNNLGPCSEGELIKLITRGKLDNNRVVAQDVLRALDIWGPSLSNTKGKTVSHKAELQEEISIINNIKADQTMFVDLMFVNGGAYLISVFKPLEYLAVSKLNKKDINTLLTATIGHINIVRKHGIRVPLCKVDGESAMSTQWFQSRIGSEGTILDTTGAGEAVSVVERKIRQIKERLRGIINTLPYRLTEQLESWLVRYVVSRINLVPTRNNPDYVSPREKLWGRRINVDKELKHGYGDYVQVHTSLVNNTMNERTSGSIALMPSGNLEGSWYYYLLANNEIVKRNRATPMPITDDIIAYLNNKALGRKGKIHSTNRPIFERGSQRNLIDDSEYESDSNIGIDQPLLPENVRTVNTDVILENIHIQDEEYPIDDDHDNDYINNPSIVNNDIVNELEHNEDIVDIYPAHINIDSPDEAVDFLDESNIRGDNQALLDSIFGIDDDEVDDNVVPHDLNNNDVDNNDITHIETEQLIEPQLEDNIYTPRRSGRNHQVNRWKKRIVGIANTKRDSLNTILNHERVDKNLTKLRHDFMKRTFSLNMTVSQAIKKLGYTAISSIVKEMIQMSDQKVLEGVTVEDLSKEQISRIITSSMFLKEKFTADGIFDKLKARLVAGGHLQDKEIYNNGSSPTLSTTSLLILSAIASRNRAVAAIDFPGAFLNSDMPDSGDHVVLMRLNKFLTSVLVKIDPTYSTYVQSNGTCVVRLKKALYGCVESAAMWYTKLSTDLASLGYTKNKLDMCVFNRIEKDNSQTTLMLHVDDMKITSKNEFIIDQVIEEIEALYPGLSKQRGRIINYLGMTFDYSISGKVKITMANYIKDVLEGCADIPGTTDFPAHNNLFRIRLTKDSSLLGDKDRERFHSLVAQLLYLSKRVRPDLLVAVSFLTKRVLSPQQDDWNKLQQAVRYLRQTSHMGIVLESENTMAVSAFIDASYGVHSDMKSHTGCVIGIGGGPVYAKSSGQKLNTKSSTEAELVALSDSTSQVIWTRNFLEEQGYNMGPAVVYQDNMSTIALVKNGKSNSDRTRHIAIRFFFVSDRVLNKEISVEYMPTGDMLADILTKPLQGALFIKLRDKLLNWY